MRDDTIIKATNHINKVLFESKYRGQPKIAIILGSGLGPLTSQVKIDVEIPYKDIPYFPVSTAPGHIGRLIFGKLDKKDVILLDGRFHFYEGYNGQDIAIVLRSLKVLGVTYLIQTNAAGGINKDFRPGDFMLITDHINNSGTNPLIGKNNSDFGPRFPDMSECYDPVLQQNARKAAQELDIDLKEGVYIWFMGPSYETPAEIRMARILGADAVGMSTVPETIIAVHAGLKVLAISVISNLAAGVSETKLDENEVLVTANAKRHLFADFIIRIISKIIL
ncbi:MAG: purine-nucleoside phosphorylase [Spirochaetia bacterium]|nr:purine-nucleoside phosphorylase [Spirochaetia bacterium]MBQ3712470.1 purine-nucleoside phosphorylase [Spirochaetia bacterium]MBQ6674478.1 purine-nucleoside phosphorylase [Spirochaetia bacterium]MBR0318231.1 purine-nucleoside phosphorylase [Spirochaetia bacterium]